MQSNSTPDPASQTQNPSTPSRNRPPNPRPPHPQDHNRRARQRQSHRVASSPTTLSTPPSRTSMTQHNMQSAGSNLTTPPRARFPRRQPGRRPPVRHPPPRRAHHAKNTVSARAPTCSVQHPAASTTQRPSPAISHSAMGLARGSTQQLPPTPTCSPSSHLVGTRYQVEPVPRTSYFWGEGEERGPPDVESRLAQAIISRRGEARKESFY